MLCWKPSHVQRTRKHGWESSACAPAWCGKESVYAEVSALPFACHSPIHCNVTLFSFCSPSHSTWFMLISSPHPCHTSCCSGSSPQSQPSVISHGQVLNSLLLLLLPAPCPVGPRSFPTWILVQDTPISPPVHQRTGPCPLIPTHILWVVLSLILHCFFAQTQ